MIRDRYSPTNVFAMVPQLTLAMDPVLAQLDRVLGDDILFGQVKAAMSQRAPQSAERGRPATPVEVVLRMLVVRRLYDWSYEDTVHFVADSLVLRQFCRVFWQEVPHGSTLDRWAGVLGPGTVEQLHERVVQLARQQRVTRGRKLRLDGTVVETLIHAPSDSSLLADGVRVLSRLLRRAQPLVDAGTRELFRDRTRSAKRRARAIGEATRHRGEASVTVWHAAYERLLATAEASVRQGCRVQALLGRTPQQGQRREQLAHYGALTEQVIEQTLRRLAGETVPAGEKVVSLFEPHTAIIKRDKPSRPLEFGHKIVLGESEGGIISDYQILPGNPGEAAEVPGQVTRHRARFGRPPRLVATDRGFHAPGTEAALQQLGVKRVVIPQQGKPPPERRALERSRWFRAGQRFRSGIEGRISVAKRNGWLGRCRDHGQEGFDRWIGWGVIANNLVAIARHAVAKATRQAA